MAEPVRVGDVGQKGKGVFACRDFRRGELILRSPRGRLVRREELESLTAWEREHLNERTADTYEVLPAPRAYLNHGCLPNAVSIDDELWAWRDIAAGEEITVDYRLSAHDDGDVYELICQCEAHGYPHVVIGDFFSLPADVQREYLPYAPTFIRAAYERRNGPGRHGNESERSSADVEEVV